MPEAGADRKRCGQAVRAPHDVRFSDRPVGVKRFRTVHQFSIAAGGVVTAQIRHALIEPIVEQLVPETSELRVLHGSQSEVDQSLAQLPPENAQKIRTATLEATYDAFAGVMEMMMVLGLLGAILYFFLFRRART